MMKSNVCSLIDSDQHGASADEGGYDPQFFAKIVEVEDRHFWFQARNRVIAAAVSDIVESLPNGYRLLEVGCGTGVVLRELAKVCRQGEVEGFDLYPEAVAFARKRAGCRVNVGDILSPSSSIGTFDVVCIFDVLEHLSNDQQILEGIRALLKPGGAIVLTVPAHMSLWSYFDVAACHCRRYNKGGLERVLQASGFQVDYLSEFMVVLFPLVWLLRRLNGARQKGGREIAAEKASAELTVVPGINLLLKLFLGWEALAVRRRLILPGGTSLLAIGRKAG